MKKAEVLVEKKRAGILWQINPKSYRFIYDDEYSGQAISLTMPLSQKIYDFDCFPPFFEGLLAEGIMLESLLKRAKIDRNDLFSQLVLVGEDVVGNVIVRELK